MKDIIITSEIISLIILSILGISSFFELKKDNTYKLYFNCILLCIFATTSDLLCYIFQNDATRTTLLYITNYLAVFLGNFIAIYAAKYLYITIYKNDNYQKNAYWRIIFIISIVNIFIQLFSFILNESFTIINGIINITKYYNINLYLQFICFIIDFIFVIKHLKDLALNHFILLLMYFLFPTISIIITIYNNDVSFVYSSLSISFLIIYIGIEKSEKEKYLLEIATHDVLTGLLNRTAYNKRISSLTDEINEVGTIFFDVNNLKHINDTLGHYAGDKLLVDFSTILISVFDKDDIYRVSGDEFVIITNKYSLENFTKKINDINNKIKNKNNIASFGYAYKKTNNINDLVALAEQNMYSEKSEYYIKNNIDRRSLK